MTAIVLLLLAWWIAAGAGRSALSIFGLLPDQPLERSVYSSALGLGLIAYALYGLGLAGGLSFGPVTALWGLAAAAGIRGMIGNAQDLGRWIRSLRTPKSPGRGLTAGSMLSGFLILVLMVCAVIAILGCFRAPAGHEWDALAYHLADPKIFLSMHRIVSLPTEHHSNFPFTMEMLFTAGLLYGGYPLANLFHCLTGLLTVLALLSFCRRWLSFQAGLIAAVVFVTTPIVLWESSVAYIDIGLGLYYALAVFAGLTLIQERREREIASSDFDSHSDSDAQSDPDGFILKASNVSEARHSPYRWAILAGAMMGFALGIKYLALFPISFLFLLFLLRRVPLKSVLIYLVVAAAVGSPWYIKNTILMRNPVYPYLFQFFPSSLYWSADRAKPYDEELKNFGYKHSPSEPATAVQNLMQTPWLLLTNPGKYTNPGDFTFTSWIGGLYAAFGLSLLLFRRIPGVIVDLLLIAALLLVSWFFLSEHCRYLLPILPLLSVAAGYSANRWLPTQSAKIPRSGVEKALVWLVILAISGQCLFVFWGLATLPSVMTPDVFESGLAPTALSIPETLSALTPENQEEMLQRRVDNYRALEWLNQQTPADAGVVMFEDVHGFYLERPYLWGNREHSSYIPYDTLRDGAALSQWFWQHGIRYVLINLNRSPDAYPAPRKENGLTNGPSGQESEALQLWYTDKVYPSGNWRKLLGEAIKEGLWQQVFAAHGVVILAIQEQPSQEIRSEGRNP